MSQIITLLDSITADAVSDPVAFPLLTTKYTMHYDATIPSGLAVISNEWSWDGVKYFTGQKVTVSDTVNGFLGVQLATFIRARVTGLGSGRTVTIKLAFLE